MSIVETLRRLVDPIAHREVQAERERDRRLARRVDRGEKGETDAPPQPAPTARYACRVCGHRSSENAYCPSCLADTMVSEVPKTETGAEG